MNLHLAKKTPVEKNDNPLSKKVCNLYHRYLLNEGIWIATRGLIALSTELDDRAINTLIDKTAAFVQVYRSNLQNLDSCI